MRREMKRRFRRYAITTVIAAAPAAVLCAYVTNLLVPTDPLPKPASFDYVPVAVINDSNDTIGIADSDIYGLSLPNGQLDTAMVDKHLQAMKDLGVDSVRVLIPWADIQPVPPGEFPTPEWEEAMWTRSQYIIDKADELGLSVLGVLNTTPSWGDDPDEPGYGIYTPPDPDLYAAWAATVAERFAGKVSAYEIWNEPNYDQYWTAGPDPEHYTEILKAAYAAIKGIDDEAMVVAGVLGTVQNSGVTMNPVDFIQRMYAADAEGFFDALSIHPYSNQISFSEGLDPNNQWQTPIEQLIAIRQLMMANDDEELKIWATEYGLSTTIKDAQTQAEWVKDFLDTWDDYDFTGPAFLYTLRDRLDTTTEEGSMGIFEFDWTEKLVAKVIRCATKGIDCGPLGEEPEEPGPDPVGELAKAIQAIVQQLYTVVTQALTAVTEFANAIVNTIVEALNNLFSAVNPAPQIADVPAETRMSIAGALTTAAAEVTGEEAPVDAVDTPVDESATPEAPAGEVAEPEVTEPDVADPAVTAPEVTEPAVTEPEVTEPEVTEPAVTEPEVTEPEVTEPEEPTVVETEAPEVPETEEPQAVEPEQPDAVEPDESDSTEEDKDTSTGRGESDESSDEDATDDDRSDSSDAGSRGGEGSTGSANGSGGGSSSSGGASGGTTGGAGGSGSGGASGGSGSGGSDGGDSGGSDGGSDGGGSGGGSGNVGYVDPAQGEVIIAA